jgi:hypothetical protein
VDDPSSTAQALAQVARAQPSLQVAVAWHPAVTAELLSWLQRNGEAHAARVAQVRLTAKAVSSGSSSVRSALTDPAAAKPAPLPSYPSQPHANTHPETNSGRIVPPTQSEPASSTNPLKTLAKPASGPLPSFSTWRTMRSRAEEAAGVAASPLGSFTARPASRVPDAASTTKPATSDIPVTTLSSLNAPSTPEVVMGEPEPIAETVVALKTPDEPPAAELPKPPEVPIQEAVERARQAVKPAESAAKAAAVSPQLDAAVLPAAGQDKAKGTAGPAQTPSPAAKPAAGDAAQPAASQGPARTPAKAGDDEPTVVVGRADVPVGAKAAPAGGEAKATPAVETAQPPEDGLKPAKAPVAPVFRPLVPLVKGATPAATKAAVAEPKPVTIPAAKPIEPTPAAKPVDTSAAAKPADTSAAAKPAEIGAAAKPADIIPAAKPVDTGPEYATPVAAKEPTGQATPAAVAKAVAKATATPAEPGPAELKPLPWRPTPAVRAAAALAAEVAPKPQAEPPAKPAAAGSPAKAAATASDFTLAPPPAELPKPATQAAKAATEVELPRPERTGQAPSRPPARISPLKWALVVLLCLAAAACIVLGTLLVSGEFSRAGADTPDQVFYSLVDTAGR